MEAKIQTIQVYAPDFPGNGMIPKRFSCQGLNVNPALQVEEIPQGTKSLAIIAEDPDAPNGSFDHWILWNIMPQQNIPENMQSGVKGLNGKHTLGYTGPCPPTGRHRYIFKVYALDRLLELQEGANRKILLDSMKPYIIGGGECMGFFEQTIHSL
jgi:Raf kinase inhibitor-like YbhB/YbcL family protein